MNVKTKSKSMSSRGGSERGIALVSALLALLLLTAIAVGMMYMSNTETQVNYNFRDSQQAFFAARAGVEEVRDRLRPKAAVPIAAPTVFPGAAGGLVYLINPGKPNGAPLDAVQPTVAGSAYFDDEFCHENFGTALSEANPGAGIRCTASIAAPATLVNSTSPFTTTAGALDYKWVRVTLKANDTAQYNTSGAAGHTQVCWNGDREVLAAPTCTAVNGYPVYTVTSLAITPQGSRRLQQYEVAAITFPAMPSPITLDGPAPTFDPTHSNPWKVNGNDHSGGAYSGPGACTSNDPTKTGIGVFGAGTASGIATGLPKPENYIGSTPTPPNPNGNPSVMDVTGTINPLLTDPTKLQTLVQTIMMGADTGNVYTVQSGTYRSGNPAISTLPSTLGTDANPQITVVDGDVDFSGNGAGILLITGNATFHGNTSFNGLVLVIGQGNITISGGGNGQYNGGMFVAKIEGPRPASPPAPPGTHGPLLSSLGSPDLVWNGGGGNGVYFDSCWTNVLNNFGYSIIAAREEMY